MRDSRNAIYFRHDGFINTIVVPFIMRCHLEYPIHNTRVNISREHTHRPFVVSWALYRIPSTWVSVTVVKWVVGFIIWPPAPYGTTTNFPLVAFPSWSTCVGRKFYAPRFASPATCRFTWHDKCLIVWTHWVSTPNSFTSFDVISIDPCLNTKFSTRHTSDHFVFHDKRSISICLC